MSSDHDRIMTSLSRLGKYLDQFKRWPETEDVDIRALTAAVEVHLARLEQLLPAGTLGPRLGPGNALGGGENGFDWAEELNRLVRVNQQCLARLIRLRDETAAELSGLRKRRKVINAYGHRARSR